LKAYREIKQIWRETSGASWDSEWSISWQAAAGELCAITRCGQVDWGWVTQHATLLLLPVAMLHLYLIQRQRSAVASHRSASDVCSQAIAVTEQHFPAPTLISYSARLQPVLAIYI